MTRAQLEGRARKYFTPQELVCSHIYARFGNGSLSYIDARLLEVLLWLRESLGRPVTINTWKSGGSLSQRGYRCNLCDLVKSKTTAYLSAHTRGQAADFDVKGLTAEDVRRYIDANKASLPHNIRLESGVSWVHLDICNETDKKIVYFRE